MNKYRQVYTYVARVCTHTRACEYTYIWLEIIETSFAENTDILADYP